MDLALAGVIVGVFGTLAMDLLNYLFARTGIILRIDVGMIGRMSAGWVHGRFVYEHPSQMEEVREEKLRGYLAHHTIGVALALPFILGWDLLVGGLAPPLWAVVYGIMTTAASYFLVFPSMGFGIFGRRSPEGLRAPLSSLANHLFYGVGLGVGVVLL